ncbi:hypothetical protein DEJ13_17420 [Curtobacterium sp. MCLR17_007]|uniref:hypothetical protein n=1 Tax=Curtobacterium sp. MCLR17_007 TaxID=2175648 RepID=UPI000DA9EB04|nr:hypothetical protein [Curtobacterium sp. MCLR17_007]WIB60195.1 hypothetical protein DEJ13_17420 [Curtobacterium sp. MCLR17_007]
MSDFDDGRSLPESLCLVATCHDPLGRFAAEIENARPALTQVFSAVAVNVTAETHPTTIAALQDLPVPLALDEHGAGTIGIGTARKDALALGLRSGCGWLFHSDLDHVLRWLADARDEVECTLARRDADFLVVGRSAVAMDAAPDRLRRTEEVVNHVYGLANGLTQRWDLMIAMRLMTRDTARLIIDHTHDAAITNDVTWPMLVSALGSSVGYAEADGIRFLARDDFDDVDRRDEDPREWRARMDTATAHVTAIVDFGGDGTV